MQTGSSGTLIGWKSGQTTFDPLWDLMEGAWLRTLGWALPTTGKLSDQIKKTVALIVDRQKLLDHE